MRPKSQIKKGIFLSYITLFLSNALGLFITPFLVRSLGPSEYGLYALIGAFVGYIAIMDFGINNAIIRYVAKYRAEEDKEGEENFLAISIILYLVIALLIVITGVILYFNIDQIFSNSLTLEELEKAKIMFLILIANLALSLPLGSFTAVLTGYENFVLPQLVGIGRIILRSILLLGLLFWGFKAVGIVILDTILNVLSMLIIAVLAIKKCNVKIKLHNFDKSLVKEIFGFSIWVFLVMIVDQIYWKLGHGVLGIYASTVAVAIFAIGIQLARYLIQISLAISKMFYPRITQMVANHASGENLTDLMIKISRLQFLIIGFIFCGFLLLGKTFIYLWLGTEFKDSWLVAVVLMSSLIFPLCNNAGMFILLAKKKHSFRAILYLTVAFLNFGLSLYLAKEYGAFGVASGTALSLIVNVVVINFYYDKFIGLDIKRYLREFQKGILLSLIVSFWLIKYVFYIGTFEKTWISLAFQVLLFSLTYTTLLWLIGISKSEKQMVRTAVIDFKKKLGSFNFTNEKVKSYFK